MAYKCQGYSLFRPVFISKVHRKEQSEQAEQTLFEFVPIALQIWPKVSLKLGGVFSCLQGAEEQIPSLTASLGSCQGKLGSRQAAALPLLNTCKARMMGL